MRYGARADPRSNVGRVAEFAGYSGPLLLDTHIWVWYLGGRSDRLAPALVQLLEATGARGELLVSDISFWEVAVKTAKGKLTLQIDPTVWLQRAERAPGIRFQPLDRETLLLSTRLRGEVHGDPADRMLIAMAQLNAVPLVTADGRIVDYARENSGTRVLDARE